MVHGRITSNQPVQCVGCHNLRHRRLQFELLTRQVELFLTILLVIVCILSVVAGRPDYVWPLSSLLAVIRGASLLSRREQRPDI